MSAKPKILLVDDREENLLALVGLLARHDAELLKAGSGEEALELLLRNEVALALVDVQMPGMDGFELAELMRGSDRTREIPLIFVTAGLHDRERIFKGYEAGAVDFLVKPLEPRALASKVGVFLELDRRKRQLGERVEQLEIALAERQKAEEEIRRSRKGLTELTRASLRIMRETNLEAMFQAISAAALELTGARVAVSGHRPVHGRFTVSGAARAPGTPACPTGNELLIEKGGIFLDLMEGAEAMRLTDAEMRAHPRWWGLPEGHVPLRGLLGVRLVDRQGRADGVILVSCKDPGDFTAEDESLLQQLGALASLAAQHVEARVSLEEADRSKNQFLAVLSHELRNPLAPIKNSLYILDRAAPGGEHARRAQQVIDRQVTQLSNLVNDLLDVTRITRNKIQLQKERLELNDVVRRTIEDNRSFFEKAQVRLDFAPAPELLHVHADGTRLAQIVSNLLQNAAKFTTAGGNTRVTVAAEGKQATVRVADDGVGIAPETVARLFQPFMQADHSLDRSKGGLGLGLALVKGLVEHHGGSISAHSAGLGEGADFVVRLPLFEMAERPEAKNASALEPHVRRRVLIIEDNVDAADSLREALELCDHEVSIACDGPEGIAKARGLRPELVLCDIGLPGMDGYEVAHALRADESLKGIALVALSGYALPEDLQRAREAGFDSHLAKPPSIEQLQALLGSLRP